MSLFRTKALILAISLAIAAFPTVGQEASKITLADVAEASAKREHSPELGWQAGCAARSARDCSSYAVFLIKSSKTPTPQDAEAVVYLERGCTLGDAAGCRLLAAFRKNGRGGAADAGKARMAIERACALGDKRSCAP